MLVGEPEKKGKVQADRPIHRIHCVYKVKVIYYSLFTIRRYAEFKRIFGPKNEFGTLFQFYRSLSRQRRFC